MGLLDGGYDPNSPPSNDGSLLGGINSIANGLSNMSNGPLGNMAMSLLANSGPSAVPIPFGAAFGRAALQAQQLNRQRAFDALQQHLLANQGLLSDMTVQGYQRAQQALGYGAPTRSGAVAGAMQGADGSVSTDTSGSNGSTATGTNSAGNVAPTSTPGLGLLGGSSVPNFAGASGVGTSADAGSAGRPVLINSLPKNSGFTPPAAHAPGSNPAPMWNTSDLISQYRIYASTPGMEQQAAAMLHLMPQAPPGAYIGVDGGIYARPGANQFVAGQEFAKTSGQKSAELQFAGPIASATEWAKVAPQLYEKRKEPFDLTRPGSVRYDGDGNIVAQTPVMVEGVDASGTPFKEYRYLYGNGGSAPAANAGTAPPRAPLLGPTPSTPGMGLLGGSSVPNFAGNAGIAGTSAATAPQGAPQASGGASGASAPAPGPNVSATDQGLPRVQTGLSPLEHESQVARGKALESYGEGLDTAAGAAVNSNFLIDQMRNESKSWQPGKFADIEADARAYLDGFRRTLNPDAPPSQPLADFQSFNKNSLELVRQAVRQTSSRAAVQEFNMIAGALPGPTMSAQGFNQIADQLQSTNDFTIAKQAAAQAWRAGHGGTLNGFDADWNKNTSPGVFLVHRMSPQSLQMMRDNLQKTPEGRATLQQLTTKLQWADKNGLFAGQ